MLPFGISASAAETKPVFHIEKEPDALRRGSSFRIVLSPAQDELSAFVLFADYDLDDVAQVKAVFSDNLKDAYLYTSEQDGRLAVVYTSKDGRCMPEDGTLTLTFRTSADSLSDSVPVHITVTDAAAADAQPLIGAPEIYELNTAFSPDPASDSTLLSLTPPAGTLVPPFDPEIFNYTLDVPFSSASLIFDAVPAQGATVRVNRKNLGAGGSTVDFSFTVTAADGETKSVYTVSVTRLTKESTTAAGSTPSSSGRGGTGSPEKADGTDTASESRADGGETGQSGTTASAIPADTVYVSSGGTHSDLRADRFETMALVLISVGAGMAFVVFVQRFGKREDTEDRDK